MAQTGEELWIKVRDGLQAKLSKPTFETFIRPTACSGFANGELKLLAPNPFASVRLREQLLPTIAEMASSISGQPVQVTVLAETALPLPAMVSFNRLTVPATMKHVAVTGVSRSN